MKTAYFVPGIVGGLLALAGCTTTETDTTASAEPKAGWACTAPNLINSRYSGGSSAYIHLKGYGSGGRYRVTKETDSRVTGTTKDGTPFTCSVQ